MTLHNPIQYIGDENGRVTKVRLQKMELGEPDASGRRSPVEIPGAIEEVECDEVIVSKLSSRAIGKQERHNRSQRRHAEQHSDVVCRWRHCKRWSNRYFGNGRRTSCGSRNGRIPEEITRA